MICVVRHANTDTEVEFPVRAYIQINGRQDLVLLFVQRIEVADWAQAAVILNAKRDFVRDFAADFRIRRKLPTDMLVFALEGFFHRWVKAEVPFLVFLIHNRAQFQRPGIGGIQPPLVAEFSRKAQPDRQFPTFGRTDARANVRADKIPSIAGTRAGEQIEPGFKPRAKPFGDFQCFMQRVMRWQHVPDFRFVADEGEVAVQFDHRSARFHRFRAIHLNLVIVLSKSVGGSQHANAKDDWKRKKTPSPNK